jgi:ABC-type glycerol-3-phosphate transport system substrate-binding protein
LLGCFANNYAFNVMGEKKVLDTYRGKVKYTDSDWIKVLSLFDTIRKEDALVSGVVTMINKTAEQTFANGKAAFSFNGSWCVNVYKGMNPDLSYGAMLPPAYGSKYPMRIWGGSGSSFMVNARSQKKEQAVQFLQWLTQAPQQTKLSEATMNLPSNKESLKTISPLLAGFAKQMDSVTHPSQWPITENPIVNERFEKGLQSILIGEKTPEQVAQDVQTVKEQQSAKP